MSASNHSPAGRVLTVNGGSSSIKFALFEGNDPPRRLHRGTIERVDPRNAGSEWLDVLQRDGHLGGLTAIGHRVVHGGPKHFAPQLVTPELLADLKQATPLDPNHLPAEIALIEALAKRLPGVPQVACFDTAFHKDLPRVASLLPIPRRYEEAGVRRYGFHGLSYTYLMGELERQAKPEIARGRVILAHLGSGSSLAAVRDGKCIDTTMGFTPTGGVMMGTRTGDIDPGVLVYMLRSGGLTADQLDEIVNKHSGLLGVSGTGSDMREIVSKMASDEHAREAFELYCYTVRKAIGALAAALVGLDTLVFSGGIGENSPEVRAAICDGLGYLGIGTANVRVIPTDEELVIAQALIRVIHITST